MNFRKKKRVVYICEFGVHTAVHRNIISIVKTNKMHQCIKLILFLERHSTCFGRSFSPSSGVQDYIQQQTFLKQIPLSAC